MANPKARSAVACLACFSCLTAGPSVAQCVDCDLTSTGLVPINDLGAGLYLDQFTGGLYPDGSNVPPLAHATEGLARAAALVPRNAEGQPHPDGRIVLLSIGMSNTTQEFCSTNGNLPCAPWTFMGQAAVDPMVDHDTLVIANGARGGQAAATWNAPTDQNYDRVRDDVLAPQGLTEAQVQAVWIKVANPGPTVSLPDDSADAYVLLEHLGNIARAVRTRYPHVQQAFVSSRIYAGYALCQLNPEPYAYESAFSTRWLIEAQVEQLAGGGVDPRAGNLGLDVAPWIAWGPYPWADGLVPRSDGVIWACGDLQNDGTHPSMSGEEKVGTMLLEFFLGSPFTEPWFRAGGDASPADVTGDGVIDVEDLVAVLLSWGPCPAPCPADVDGDGVVSVEDLTAVILAWG